MCGFKKYWKTKQTNKQDTKQNTLRTTSKHIFQLNKKRCSVNDGHYEFQCSNSSKMAIQYKEMFFPFSSSILWPFTNGSSIADSTRILYVQIQLQGSKHDFKAPAAHAENAGWLDINHEIVHFWGGFVSVAVLTYPQTEPITADITEGIKSCGIWCCDCLIEWVGPDISQALWSYETLGTTHPAAQHYTWENWNRQEHHMRSPNMATSWVILRTHLALCR